MEKQRRTDKKSIQFLVDMEFFDDIEQVADRLYDGNVAMTARMALRQFVEANKSVDVREEVAA